MHPGVADAETVLAAARARVHAPDLPDVTAAGSRRRVELDRALGVDHGASVGRGLGKGKWVERGLAEERRRLGEDVRGPRQHQLVSRLDDLVSARLAAVRALAAQ